MKKQIFFVFSAKYHEANGYVEKKLRLQPFLQKVILPGGAITFWSKS